MFYVYCIVLFDTKNKKYGASKCSVIIIVSLYVNALCCTDVLLKISGVDLDELN